VSGPRTDRDKREIAVTIRKVLSAGRHPELRFTATAFEVGPHGADGTIAGTLSLAGQFRPQVSQTAPGRYRATTTVWQTDFGMRPYSGLLGALKVSDPVDIEVDLSLRKADDEEPAK
jgi:polyisoprenoid-binding protein YceI